MTDVLAPGAADLEEHRIELAGYCYRMLGSAFETDDAVQETMIRAWKALDRFDGRSTLRTWLYRIATNVCIDLLNSRKRRATPMDLGPSSTWDATNIKPLTEQVWVEPIPDGRVLPEISDPADLAIARDSIRLAFVAALQHLPPKQRAVLILREVLRFHADEVAELLDTSVASVNSALQRARATLETKGVSEHDEPPTPISRAQEIILRRYLDAFERYDVESFVGLLHEEVRQAMPPYAHWLIGRDQIRGWMLGPGIGCRGSRFLPVQVNGVAGFAQYRPSGPDGRHEPWSIHVPTIDDDGVVALDYFLDTTLFELFGLPQHPDDAA